LCRSGFTALFFIIERPVRFSSNFIGKMVDSQ